MPSAGEESPALPPGGTSAGPFAHSSEKAWPHRGRQRAGTCAGGGVHLFSVASAVQRPLDTCPGRRALVQAVCSAEPLCLLWAMHRPLSGHTGLGVDGGVGALETAGKRSASSWDTRGTVPQLQACCIRRQLAPSERVTGVEEHP